MVTRVNKNIIYECISQTPLPYILIVYISFIINKYNIVIIETKGSDAEKFGI